MVRIPGVGATLQAGISRRIKGSTGGPGPEQRAHSGSDIVAEALDPTGRALATSRLVGVNGYTFTAAIIAWAAERVAAGGLLGSGALGPVDGLGLETLEAGVEEAGLSRAADWQ